MEQTEVLTEKKVPVKGKKRPLPLRILGGFFTIVLALILLLIAWIGFSTFNKKSTLSVLPAGGGLYIHTDSVWKALNPLMDLQAADIMLAEPAFMQFRGSFMELRSSAIRQSKLVAALASRTIDIVVYPDADAKKDALPDIVAAVDLSYLSAFTRPASLYARFLNTPGLAYTAESGVQYFSYNTGTETVYFKPIKNLLVVATNLQRFLQAVGTDNGADYSLEEKMALSEKSKQPVRLLADARKLVALAPASPAVDKLLPLLKENTLTSFSFGITDSDIGITARVPLVEKSDLSALIDRSSTMPALLSRFSDIVQYYTILNAGTLQELKESLLPYVPPEKNAELAWARADSMCKKLFSLHLDDILFSWTGTEFAAFGIEGQNIPVFAVQITNEAKRAEVFDQILSSFLIKDDTSLILDGVRLPRITVPGFISDLLAVFNISLPAPYYLIHDGYIYFSTAPEALSSVYSSMQSGRKLSRHANWKAVSADQKAESAVSLYYNLERSMPFFLRGNSVFTKVLQLYTIGRADMRMNNAVMTLQLHAAARRAGDLRTVPGFPVALDGPVSPELLLEGGKKRTMLFWLENGKTVHTFDIADSAGAHTMTFPDTVSLAVAPKPVQKTGVLWAATKDGGVYLLERDLKPLPGFPVLLDERVSAPVAASGESLFVPLANGSVCRVDASGKIAVVELPVTGSLRAAPAVLGSVAAVYDKSFLGKIFVIDNDRCINAENPYSVPGIAFGSPALLKQGKVLYVAFVTQAGQLFVWADGELKEGFPLQLEGVFYTNVVASGNYFYALSEDAHLHRIGLDGSVLTVAVPHATAKNAYMTAADPNENGVHNIYVCPDGNTLYGFTSSLELISGFPVTGWGVPAFADVNGDRNADCFVLTLDNTLTAWNLR